MNNMTEDQKRVLDYVDTMHHNRELDKRVDSILNSIFQVINLINHKLYYLL